MENRAFVFFLPFPSVPKSCWDSQFQCPCFVLVLLPISLFLGPTLPGEVLQRELISTTGVPTNLSHLPQGLRKSSVTSRPRPLQEALPHGRADKTTGDKCNSFACVCCIIVRRGRHRQGHWVWLMLCSASVGPLLLSSNSNWVPGSRACRWT